MMRPFLVAALLSSASLAVAAPAAQEVESAVEADIAALDAMFAAADKCPGVSIDPDGAYSFDRGLSPADFNVARECIAAIDPNFDKSLTYDEALGKTNPGAEAIISTNIEDSLDEAADRLTAAADAADEAARAEAEARMAAIAETHADDWYRLGTNDNGIVVYLRLKDALLAKPRGRANKVWVKYDARKAKSVPFMESISLLEIDCVNETFKSLSRTEHYRNGSAISRRVNPYDIKHIVPDTNVDSVAEEVCPAS